jgi:hypothetical protein
MDKVLGIAISRDLRKEVHVYPDEVIAACMLYPGFLARNEITDVSGRGVGREAAMGELTEYGGKLELPLEKKTERAGRAFRFIMLLHFDHLIDSRFESRVFEMALDGFSPISKII